MTSDATNALAFAAKAPHEFTIQYPPRRAYFGEFRTNEALPALTTNALLYVHVPFCRSRCTYCNFPIDLGRDASRKSRYVDAVVRQIRSLEMELGDNRLFGVDIGGGTPTELTPADLHRLLGALTELRSRAAVDNPLSIESTPNQLADVPQLVEVLQRHQVDRVSLGVQREDTAALAQLGRSASRTPAKYAMQLLRSAKIRRTSVDVIFGLPNQNAETFRRDLDFVLELEPDAITTYDCLYRGQGRNLLRKSISRKGLSSRQTLPTPEMFGELYDLAFEHLRTYGYACTSYGSLNFSRHVGETGVSPYFERRILDGFPYRGLGSGASSWIDDHWTFANDHVDDFVHAVETGRDTLSDHYLLPKPEQIAKYLLGSLSFGVIDDVRLALRFGVSLTDVLGDMERAVSFGLRSDANCYRLAPGSFRNLPMLRALFWTNNALRHVQSTLE